MAKKILSDEEMEALMSQGPTSSTPKKQVLNDDEMEALMNPQPGVVDTAKKVAGSGAVGLVKGAVDAVNPLNYIKAAKQIPETLGQLKEDFLQEPLKTSADVVKGGMSLLERPVNLAAAGIQQGLEKTGLIPETGRSFSEELARQEQDTKEGYHSRTGKQVGQMGTMVVAGPAAGAALNIGYGLGDSDRELSPEKVGETVGSSLAPLALTKGASAVKGLAKKFGGIDDTANTVQRDLGRQGVNTSERSALDAVSKDISQQGQRVGRIVDLLQKKAGRKYDQILKEVGDRQFPVKETLLGVIDDIDQEIASSATAARVKDLQDIKKLLVEEVNFQNSRPQNYATGRATELELKDQFQNFDKKGDALQRVKNQLAEKVAAKTREVAPELKPVDKQYRKVKELRRDQFTGGDEVPESFTTSVKNYKAPGQTNAVRQVDDLVEALDDAKPGLGAKIKKEASDLSQKYQASKTLQGAYKWDVNKWTQAANNYIGRSPKIDSLFKAVDRMDKLTPNLKVKLMNSILLKMKQPPLEEPKEE